MKDYNYYKTISDICNELNDIYKKFNVKNIIPIGKIRINDEQDQGDSFIIENDEEKHLMVETSTDFNWVGTRLRLYEIKNLNVNVAKYLHDYCQEDHNDVRHTLFVFSYIDGEYLKDYLLKVNNNEAYKLGIQLGKILNEIHLVKVDVLKHHIPHWESRYRYTKKHILNEYQENSVTDKAFNYYKGNESIIERRYTTSEYYCKVNGEYLYKDGKIVIEKTLAFIINDIRMDNLIVSNNQVYIKCPINITIGDPFYDFKYLSLLALENEYFASGVIKGYFDNEISIDFFKMLKYYTCELIITEYNKSLDINIINKLIEFYDDFNLEIPKWYKKDKTKV